MINVFSVIEYKENEHADEFRELFNMALTAKEMNGAFYSESTNTILCKTDNIENIIWGLGLTRNDVDVNNLEGFLDSMWGSWDEWESEIKLSESTGSIGHVYMTIEGCGEACAIQYEEVSDISVLDDWYIEMKRRAIIDAINRVRYDITFRLDALEEETKEGAV